MTGSDGNSTAALPSRGQPHGQGRGPRRRARLAAAGTRTLAGLLAGALLATGCSFTGTSGGKDERGGAGDKVGQAAEPSDLADPVRQPFFEAFDALAAHPALRIVTDRTDRIVTAAGIEIGTAVVDGVSVDMTTLLGTTYFKPGINTAVKMTDLSLPPETLRDRWFVDSGDWTGPTYLWAAPPALAQLLRRAVTEVKDARPVGDDVDGTDARRLATPAGDIYISAAAPHKLLGFTPTGGAGPSAAPDMAGGSPVPLRDMGGRPGPAIRTAAHRSDGAAGGPNAPGAMGVYPVQVKSVEEAYNNIRQALADAKKNRKSPINPKFRLGQSAESVQCNNSGCTVSLTVTAKREPRSVAAGRNFDPDAEIVALLTAEFSIQGSPAGACEQSVALTEGVGAPMTCSYAPAGAIMAQAQVEAEARARASAAPGTTATWQVPFRGEWVVFATAQNTLTLADGVLDAALDNLGKFVPPDPGDRVSGSKEGAQSLLPRALAYHRALSPGDQRTTVVAVIRVRKIGAARGAPDEFEIWVATSKPGAAWPFKGTVPNMVEIFISGLGHAEKTIIDALYVDGVQRYQIVEGASSLNVCLVTPNGRCSSQLHAEGLTIGGDWFPWLGGGIKSDYRIFWYP
ncbi:hypothetical protein [Yinghuangia soli]|uniref:Uncharacterized protein n=1 Tax=Yinghuangia soli TaxID=2908204 RepID=A0AA41Q3H9_9ACTN|nr:hypothetical protein [Yinghuangia soli]MCF2530873.1 hypothetical protein [Yinghuangia soli]